MHEPVVIGGQMTCRKPWASPVLEQFCLTRPFPGPAEADHIQEYPLTTG